MTQEAATINLEWDSRGKIRHNIKVENFSANPVLWLFAPSAPMLFTHQLGSMRPSHGLILCSKVLEIIRTDKYIFTPINTALKGARIEFVWVQNQTVMLQYFPLHSFVHNNDSLEEGSRQLVVNYFYHVFASLSKYGKLATKSFSAFAIDNYLDFLYDQLQSGKIGIKHDNWSQEFIYNSQQDNYLISARACYGLWRLVNSGYDQRNLPQ